MSMNFWHYSNTSCYSLNHVSSNCGRNESICSSRRTCNGRDKKAVIVLGIGNDTIVLSVLLLSI